MKLVITLFLIIAALTGCDTKAPFNCKCNTSNLSYNDSVVNAFIHDTTYFNRQKNNYHLQKLESLGIEAFRLKMEESFSRYEQIYTLVKTDHGAELDVREYFVKRIDDCDTQIVAGKEYLVNCVSDIDYTLVKRYLVKLSAKQWQSIKSQSEAGCYWSNKIGEGVHPVLDGGSWILEGVDPEERNCANRKNNIDVCLSYSDNELGDLCRKIRKYAHEDRLHMHKW